jgi:hypothetical protein
MRIIVSSLTLHEITIDDDGKSPWGQYYLDIPDVLEDDTADDYEKTRTIIECVRGTCPDSTTSEYSVFVYDDNGTSIFTGRL